MADTKPLTCPYCDTPFKGKPADGLLCAKCMIKFEQRQV